MCILFRYRIVVKTMTPLFHAFQVSLVVVEASVVAFLWITAINSHTMPEQPYSHKPLEPSIVAKKAVPLNLPPLL